MTDLHERFAAWVVGGAEGDPPRDLALHASGCARCLAVAGALDSLRRVDVGGAAEPPSVPAARGEPVGRRVGRAIAGLATIAFTGAAIVVATGVLRPPPASIGSLAATPTPFAQEVLGQTPESPTPAPDESGTPTAEPSPSGDPSEPTAPATAVPTPAPILTPVPTPRPSPAPTPAPVPTSNATPSPAPTPVPTATPTTPPRPTPTPTFLPSLLPSIAPSLPPPSQAP